MWTWEAVLLEHIVQLQIPLWSQSLRTMPTGAGTCFWSLHLGQWGCGPHGVGLGKCWQDFGIPASAWAEGESPGPGDPWSYGVDQAPDSFP